MRSGDIFRVGNVAPLGGALAAGWHGLRCGECARRAVTPAAAPALPRCRCARHNVGCCSAVCLSGTTRNVLPGTDTHTFQTKLLTTWPSQWTHQRFCRTRTTENCSLEDCHRWGLILSSVRRAYSGRPAIAGRQTGRHLGPFSDFWRDRQYQFEDGPSYWKIKVRTSIAATDSYS